MKRQVFYTVLAVVGGLILIALLLFDVRGGGTFLLGVGISLVTQAVIASLIFGLLMVILLFLMKVSGFSMSLPIVLVSFVIAAIIAMLLLPRLSSRPIAIYDFAQTIVMCGAFYLIARRVERLTSKASPGQPSVSARPPRLSTPRPTLPRHVRTPPKPGTSSVQPRSASYQALYQDLLRKAGGDHETATRLIEYERQRMPSASEEKLLENAIWHWERDNW